MTKATYRWRMRFLWVGALLALGCSGSGANGTDSSSSGGASATGGAETGGSSSGGDAGAGGGSASGGVSSGGSDSSGGASGGTKTGGASSGGQQSGGAGTGGNAPDADDDGVPDSADQCPGGDDNQDLNDNDEIDECEPGWCRIDSSPQNDLCSIGNGLRQGYCTLETKGAADPGECVQCATYRYDCNDDWSDGCETYETGPHPCFPE